MPVPPGTKWVPTCRPPARHAPRFRLPEAAKRAEELSAIDIWSQRKSNSTLDLQIDEQEGPFWTISIAAYDKRSQAKKKARDLREQGWDVHIADLTNYGSAKYRSFWYVYIGPYSYDSRSEVKRLLRRVQNEINPKSYAVTLGQTGERKQFK